MFRGNFIKFMWDGTWKLNNWLGSFFSKTSGLLFYWRQSSVMRIGPTVPQLWGVPTRCKSFKHNIVWLFSKVEVWIFRDTNFECGSAKDTPPPLLWSLWKHASFFGLELRCWHQYHDFPCNTLFVEKIHIGILSRRNGSTNIFFFWRYKKKNWTYDGCETRPTNVLNYIKNKKLSNYWKTKTNRLCVCTYNSYAYYIFIKRIQIFH